MSKIHDKPESLNEGGCLRYMMNRNRHLRGVFRIYDEPESPNEGACFKMYDDPESPNERACLRYMMKPPGLVLIHMMNRNRQMRGGGCLRYMMNMISWKHFRV